MSGRDLTRLNRAIRAQLSDGLRLSTESLEQIDSAFGWLSPAQVKTRLADAGDCETATLVHLIFSPEPPTQIRLEPVLCLAAWSPEDIEALQLDLVGRMLQTTLRFADGRQDFDVAMPPEGIEVFIAGLHMDRFIPEPVARAIDRHLPAGSPMAARVALRNTPIVYHPPVVDFLCRLFRRSSRLQPDLQDCVAIAAALAATADEDTDLFKSLAALKTAHARRLRQAEISESALKRGNTESLMLGGNRLFQIDRRETLHRMACIDAVALAAFDRLPAGLETVQTLALDGHHAPRDVLRHIGHLFH
jgi:hypothetical protein